MLFRAVVCRLQNGTAVTQSRSVKAVRLACVFRQGDMYVMLASRPTRWLTIEFRQLRRGDRREHTLGIRAILPEIKKTTEQAGRLRYSLPLGSQPGQQRDG
jgi:hypothetical protein